MPGRKKGQRAKRAPAQTGTMSLICHPPQLASNFVSTRTQRFQATSTLSVCNVSPETLCFSFGSMCTTTNSTITALWKAVRVRRVRMWAPGSLTTTSTISCEWTSKAASVTGQSNVYVADTSVSSAYPAFLDTTPPKGSLASFWNPSGDGTIVFNLLGPAETIVDVTVDLLMDVSANSNPTIAGWSSVVQGAIYYAALDNAVSTTATCPATQPLTSPA